MAAVTHTAHGAAMHAPDQLDHCPLMPTYGPPQVQFVRGQGVRLWDSEGNEYLDLLVGARRRHRSVTAIRPSPRPCTSRPPTLLHVSNLFGTEPGWEVAVTLDRLLGGGGQVFFANSGAEANECALKLARKWGGRGKHVVISALGIVPRPHARHAPRHRPAPEARGVPAPSRGLPPRGLERPRRARTTPSTPSVAAILLEPVQGEGGVNPATTEYFQGVRRLCDERGLLFMVDEVQTGLGRTGEWFGHQHFGVVPDVVTMAKALGNGVPDRSLLGQASVGRGPSSPATTPPPTAVSPSPRRRPRPCSPSWSVSMLPALAAKVGDYLHGGQARRLAVQFGEFFRAGCQTGWPRRTRWAGRRPAAAGAPPRRSASRPGRPW